MAKSDEDREATDMECYFDREEKRLTETIVDTAKMRRIASALFETNRLAALNAVETVLEPASHELDRLRAENATLKADVARLKDVLIDALTDIREWVQLAKYQRETLDHDKTPCPTEYGIGATEVVLAKAAGVLRSIQIVIEPAEAGEGRGR